MLSEDLVVLENRNKRGRSKDWRAGRAGRPRGVAVTPGQFRRLKKAGVQCLLDGRDLLLARLVGEGGAPECAAGFLEALEMLLDPLDVLETELGIDDLHVAARVDITLDVDDLSVVEGADDLEDTIDGADVGQESVAETCTC